jgi:hypothetical protein
MKHSLPLSRERHDRPKVSLLLIPLSSDNKLDAIAGRSIIDGLRGCSTLRALDLR